jgi:hypothetical protein|tara:strand:+ start:638 stop:1189 length:552 start_codon:yes stop_codon:yes gene_type:complete
MEQQQQEQQQPPQIRSNPYASPMYNYGSSILLLTNPQNELHKLELTFRSLSEDDDGNVKEMGEPLMNEKGISSVLGQAQALINQDTVMSNLDKTDISGLIDFLADTLAQDLMTNRVAYEIKVNAGRGKIYFETLALTYITLRRAYLEGDKRFWKGSQQEITTRVEGNNQKGSMLGKVMGWGKK